MHHNDKMHYKHTLLQLFNSALAAIDVDAIIPRLLPSAPIGKTIVIGAGKASARMAQAVEKVWQGHLEGAVVTQYGYAVACERIEVMEAAHPIPDEAGLIAARRMMELAASAEENDLLLFLFSGGGSALMVMPVNGLTFQDKQVVNQQLLQSGASITEINCVRKHLSQIKGGQLAQQGYPAKMMALMMSDVPDDNPAAIASGPVVADSTTSADALHIIKRYGIYVPDNIISALAEGALETPKMHEHFFDHVTERVIASSQMSLQAAADTAKQLGLQPLILGNSIEGESKEVAKVMAAIALQIKRHAQPVAPPCVILSGGETTVTVLGDGVGGSNAEFLLALAIALQGEDTIYALACDTDGIDGAAEAAGAWIHPDTCSNAAAKGLCPQEYLDNNDSHTFFHLLNDQIITGPTLTNVNDFRAIIIV